MPPGVTAVVRAAVTAAAPEAVVLAGTVVRSALSANVPSSPRR